MSQRSICSLFALALAAPPAAAQAPLVRLTEVAKDGARLEVVLDAPATVELEYGEELFAWEGRAESLAPESRHELVLTKLLPDRQYFYRLLVDGFDTGEVLTFRSGRSWIDRTAELQVTADRPSGGTAEAAAAERFFAEPAHALIALGGDGGDPEAFHALHGRTLSERLVVETGGTGDTLALRTAAVSDVAIASVGENPLVLAGGAPSPAAGWLATALPTVEGACWSLAASAAEVRPGSAEAEALLAWAAATGIHVVLTPSPEPVLVERGGAIWLGLPDGQGDDARPTGRVTSAGGTLIVKLEGAGGEPRVASLTRDCPIPQALLAQAGLAAGDEEDGFGGGSSDFDGDAAADCDY